MSVTENLAVQMHQQDTDYYRGGACAQMVLETIGAGLLAATGTASSSRCVTPSLPLSAAAQCARRRSGAAEENFWVPRRSPSSR
jgi:hypothetical protein